MMPSRKAPNWKAELTARISAIIEALDIDPEAKKVRLANLKLSYPLDRYIEKRDMTKVVRNAEGKMIRLGNPYLYMETIRDPRAVQAHSLIDEALANIHPAEEPVQFTRCVEKGLMQRKGSKYFVLLGLPDVLKYLQEIKLPYKATLFQGLILKHDGSVYTSESITQICKNNPYQE